MKPQPTTPTTISAGCLRAAEIISERGWTQGMTSSLDGAVCACKAISEAVPAVLAGDVLAAFRAQLGIDNIVDWNDASGRTAEEVIAAFRATAWAHAGR